MFCLKWSISLLKHFAVNPPQLYQNAFGSRMHLLFDILKSQCKRQKVSYFSAWRSSPAIITCYQAKSSFSLNTYLTPSLWIYRPVTFKMILIFKIKWIIYSFMTCLKRNHVLCWGMLNRRYRYTMICS